MHELDELKKLALQLNEIVAALEKRVLLDPRIPKPPTDFASIEAGPAQMPEEIIPAGIPVPASKPAPVFAPKIPRDWEEILGKRLMTVVGVLFMIFGFGYFLKYSIERNLIEPPIRILIGLVVATVLLGVGEYVRRKKYLFFAYSLMGGGIAGYYFSIYGAQQLYHLIDPLPAVMGLLAVTAFACGLALFYEAKALAILGALGGFLTPVFFKGNVSPDVLFFYVLLLNAGLLTVSVYKSWRVLTTLGFLFTWLLFGTYEWEFRNLNRFWLAMAYINVSFLAYSLMPLAHQIIRKAPQKLKGLGILIPNTLIALAFNYHWVTREYSRLEMSLVTLGNAAFFLSIATYLRGNKREHLQVFNVVLALAMFFIVLTVPMAFAGRWITLSWILMGAVLIHAGYRMLDRKIVIAGWVISALGLFHVLFFHSATVEFNFERWWYFPGNPPAFWQRLIFYVAFVGCLVRSALETYRHEEKVKKPLLWGFSLFALWFAFLFSNMEVSAYCDRFLPAGKYTAISVVWGLYTLGLMIVGARKKIAGIRYLSLLLFLLTASKVVAETVGGPNTGLARVADLVFLGCVLLLTAFLFIRFKDAQEPRS